MIFKVLFFVPIIMIGTLFADVNAQIKSSKSQIADKKSQEKKISHALDKIAKDISKQKRTLQNMSSKINQCRLTIQKLSKKTRIKGTELKKVEDIYRKLAKKEKQVSKQVVNILSKELSIEMITKGAKKDNKHILQSYETNIDDIVMNEVLHTYTKILRAQFKKTKSKYIKLNKSMDLIKNEIKKLSDKVDILKVKKSDLAKLKTKQNKSITSLKKQKKRYVTKLNRIKKEQNALDQTLQKLHVTKVNRDKTIIHEDPSSDVKVRQIGSSYQHTALATYHGAKTISPLKDYSVTQKFGNYTDPIYKIKIFNESVILRAKQQNAKVRNVLKGTVIYAEKTPILDNVVIIKHPNNLHTIYAHLSQIAPTIKVGKKVKKSYILGRVHRELTFEVTKDTKHINPLKLIK